MTTLVHTFLTSMISLPRIWVVFANPKEQVYLCVDHCWPFRHPAVLVQGRYVLQNKGEKFAVAEGQALDLAGAGLGMVVRAGTGSMVQGYTLTVVDEDTSKYTVQSAGNRMVKESTSVRPDLLSCACVTGEKDNIPRARLFTFHLQDIPKFHRPQKPIAIYQFDSCPDCKKVREMICVLDLDVLIYPCPRSGPTFRPQAIAKSGKSRFPYMEDPNTGVSMNQADDIVQYLADTYGDGSVPLGLQLGAATDITARLAGMGRYAHVFPSHDRLRNVLYSLHHTHLAIFAPEHQRAAGPGFP